MENFEFKPLNREAGEKEKEKSIAQGKVCSKKQSLDVGDRRETPQKEEEEKVISDKFEKIEQKSLIQEPQNQD